MAESEKDGLLGKVFAIPTSRGVVKVGDRVKLVGVVTRTHKSGFCQVDLPGQPQILILAENAEVVDE